MFSSVLQFKEHEDYVAALEPHVPKKMLCCAGGDGFFSVFDLRKGELFARSDNMEEDILSLAIIKVRRPFVVASFRFRVCVWGSWLRRVLVSQRTRLHRLLCFETRPLLPRTN